MNVTIIRQDGRVQHLSDVDLVDLALRRGGVSLYRRLSLRQSGQVQEWLQARHTVEEMLSLARAGDTAAAEHEDRRSA